jgi:hypothetical protein
LQEALFNSLCSDTWTIIFQPAISSHFALASVRLAALFHSSSKPLTLAGILSGVFDIRSLVTPPAAPVRAPYSAPLAKELMLTEQMAESSADASNPLARRVL